MRPTTTRSRPAALAVTTALLVALAGCGTATEPGAATAEPTTPDGAEAGEPQVAEAAAVTPRLAITYDGGIQVLDATTLEVVEDIELAGFNRLSAAGDGRHLMVSTAGGFQVLDAGTWAEPHGDHSHYYTSVPALTDTVFAADTPGHVVVHEGRTALFDDGTGEVVVLDAADVATAGVPAREHTTPSPHHGVAVELTDGTLVVSEGDEDGRTGIRAIAESGEETASSDECPGLHGEAVAAGESVLFGCEDGALLYQDGVITKVSSPDDYGRIGNQSGTEGSTVVLGDYKTDPDAELERPTRVSLVDTATAELTLVDLPASYSFRSLARGESGEALVLGTDGQVHVIDPATGELTTSIPVIDAWEEPLEWQRPRPTISMLAGSAYVTAPATRSIHAVDIETGQVWNSAQLDVEPNELAGVSGDVPAAGHAAGEDEHAHDGEHAHDHDDAQDGEHGHDHEDGHGH
ncbi:zinc metallochaperone AztD [Georgenia sp. MJ170]|uniref:zinc metallochaperone AztD n=1 Tax=Georgenia sunbinii TaxID=3117728 RepID=UPI002F25EF04